jgi:hypothetical protein
MQLSATQKIKPSDAPLNLWLMDRLAVAEASTADK